MLEMDFAQIKSRILMTALQVVNDPRVMKVLSYPKVMNAVTRGIALKDKIDATIRIWTEEDPDNRE